MKTTNPVSTSSSEKAPLKEVLFICGILAPLLYVGSDIIAAMSWEGYSYTAQSVSELRAFGAPTRPFLIPILLIYALLEIAFAWGIRGTTGQKRALRVTAVLLLVLGAVDLIAPFTSMHLREAEKTLTDKLHIIFTIVTVLLILSIIGLGAFAGGKRFRLYSFGTILVLVVCGAWAFLDAPRIEANLPTPWLGVRERINIYGYMLWLAMLAIILLRGKNKSVG